MKYRIKKCKDDETLYGGNCIDNNIYKIIEKYEKKDYWGHNNYLEESKFPKEVENYLMDEMRKNTSNWVLQIIQKIENKDENYLRDNLRYDQKFTKEIFSEVTGINVKSKSTKDLNKVLDKYLA